MYRICTDPVIISKNISKNDSTDIGAEKRKNNDNNEKNENESHKLFK